MNTKVFILCSLWVCSGSNLQAATSVETPTVSQNLVNDVYRPLHSNFAVLSEHLANDIVGLCERRPASSAFKLQTDFTDLIEAFSAIELFRIGPLLADNRKNRLFYWPDKRRVAGRQLQALLESNDAETISVDQLGGKSVALQGFTALERLLFTADLHPLEEAPQCHLILVIIRNIANMATELNTVWWADSEYIQSLLLPTKDSKHFRTADEVLRTVYTQAKVGLDIVLHDKIAPLLSDKENQMSQAPLWISQRTIAMLTGNLRGLQILLLDSGILANTRFQEELRFEFEYVERVLKKLKPRVYLIDTNGKLIQEISILLNQLSAVVSGISYVVSTDIAKTLNIKAGFNSDEGD